MKSGSLLLEREGHVATVVFNRPERLNAFVPAMYDELRSLLAELENEDELRVVVFTGNGRAFCAGEDLKELEAESERGLDSKVIEARLDLLQDVTRRIVRSRIVYIAAVNGVAAGFGAELALSCDLRVGGESARFVFPEVRRGLFVTNGVTYFLPRIVGVGRAMKLLLTGDPIEAGPAERWGLLEPVIPDGELLATAKTLARAIAANSPLSVTLTKRALREGASFDLEGALRREIDLALECFEGGAHLEGARAFVEKREARFD